MFSEGSGGEVVMRKAICLLLLWLLGPTAGAATLDVRGGILYGAGGVLVNGTLYDVSFVDGTCVGLFSGCDSPLDLPFPSGAAAAAASQALLDQVFLDGPLGAFDSNPTLTLGCEAAFQIGACSVFTPFDTLVNNALADNSSVEAFDAVRAAFTLAGEDLTPYGTVVYGVWTVAVVPEPATALLWALGLVLILSMGFRRQPASRRT
jgi:hypothetical protein